MFVNTCAPLLVGWTDDESKTHLTHTHDLPHILKRLFANSSELCSTDSQPRGWSLSFTSLTVS